MSNRYLRTRAELSGARRIRRRRSCWLSNLARRVGLRTPTKFHTPICRIKRKTIVHVIYWVTEYKRTHKRYVISTDCHTSDLEYPSTCKCRWTSSIIWSNVLPERFCSVASTVICFHSSFNCLAIICNPWSL